MKEKIQLKKIAKMTVIASPNYDQIRVHNAQRESWFPVMGSHLLSNDRTPSQQNGGAVSIIRLTCPVVVVRRGDSYSTQKTHLHASKTGK